MQAPFSVSDDAARYLRPLLTPQSNGMIPSLHMAYRLEARDKSGRLIERCDREHYFIGCGMPSDYPEHTRCHLLGQSVAIHPGTLAHLTGKHLVLGQTDPIEGIDHTKEVLFAVPREEETPKT